MAFYKPGKRDMEGCEDLWFAHVDAMTKEDLFAKTHIAAELAVRDHEINRLRAALEEIRRLDTYHINPGAKDVGEFALIAEAALEGEQPNDGRQNQN